MTLTLTRISPADHGRRMTLDEFADAEFQEGYIYELGKGIVVVSDVPKPKHLAQVDAIRIQFYSYRAKRPSIIHRIASGGECKILLSVLESERHPDIAIYKSEPPEEDIWSSWIPAVVIEVVSPGSEIRDYEEKRDEYLQFGVLEYWIIDAERREMLVHRRLRRPLDDADGAAAGRVQDALPAGFGIFVRSRVRGSGCGGVIVTATCGFAKHAKPQAAVTLPASASTLLVASESCTPFPPLLLVSHRAKLKA